VRRASAIEMVKFSSIPR